MYHSFTLERNILGGNWEEVFTWVISQEKMKDTERGSGRCQLWLFQSSADDQLWMSLTD